jgi:acyl-coenzyme A thioesterase PaaI-like protein
MVKASIRASIARESLIVPSADERTIESFQGFFITITKDTGLLRAEGNLLSFGQRVAFAEAKLTDAQGKLYASATSTLLVFNR